MKRFSEDTRLGEVLNVIELDVGIATRALARAREALSSIVGVAPYEPTTEELAMTEATRAEFGPDDPAIWMR